MLYVDAQRYAANLQNPVVRFISSIVFDNTNGHLGFELNDGRAEPIGGPLLFIEQITFW